MSYDIEILVDVPGLSFAEVVEANLEGPEELAASDVDLLEVADRVRRALPDSARVDASASFLDAFDPSTGLQVDLTREGGQVILPLSPSAEVLDLAAAVVRALCDETPFVGYDPQQETPFPPDDRRRP